MLKIIETVNGKTVMVIGNISKTAAGEIGTEELTVTNTGSSRVNVIVFTKGPTVITETTAI